MNTETGFESAQVLLVEDSEDDVELTLAALEDSKVRMDVHVVSDGAAAMRFLLNEAEFRDKPRPDLVLLDLNLPIMDGREVLQAIRDDPDLTGMPVVVLTTSQNEEDIVKMYSLHANCYITKPVDFDQFTRVIRQVEGFWFQLVKLPSKKRER
jgi:two-component system response regulator